MTGRLDRRALSIVSVFAIGLIMTGLLRAAQFGTSPLAAVGRFATPVYIGLTILAAVLLLRRGAPFRRFGFELPFRPALHIGLAIAAVIVIRLSSALLDPWLEGFFGGGRGSTHCGKDCLVAVATWSVSQALLARRARC